MAANEDDDDDQSTTNDTMCCEYCINLILFKCSLCSLVSIAICEASYKVLF